MSVFLKRYLKEDDVRIVKYTSILSTLVLIFLIALASESFASAESFSLGHDRLYNHNQKSSLTNDPSYKILSSSFLRIRGSQTPYGKGVTTPE